MRVNHFTSHPWHGISAGENSPNIVNVFIEITPSDTIKYEIDKGTGFLKVDRPQKYSNTIPALYGFIPKTYCEKEVKELAKEFGSEATEGDNDPLDICVLTSHHIQHSNILLKAKPIGGFCMIDKNEVDDKIIAVLEGDHAYGEINNISELPSAVVERLKHYFLTYKNLPDQPATCKIIQVYSQEHAKLVIEKSQIDYINCFV